MAATVEVALTAWTNNPARLGYFKTTMLALKQNLTASRHAITRILVSSEVLETEYRVPFEALCRHFDVDLHYHPAPPEIGCNHNQILSLCEADYVLYTEDDCLLNESLDVSDDIDFLEACTDFVYVRYSLAPWSKMTPLGGEWPGLGDMDKSLPYPYSNTAHLRHRERFATFGPFAENAAWGGQEIGMGGKVTASSYKIAGRAPGPFGHMGKFGSQPERWPKGETPC